MCVFCELLQKRENIIYENELAFAIYDNYPVTEGHALVISKRHFASFFNATEAEIFAINQALRSTRELLEKRFRPDGYNLGVNQGEAAGQSVMHLHVHLIPRHFGDVIRPRGGVRSVIPGKQDY